MNLLGGIVSEANALGNAKDRQTETQNSGDKPTSRSQQVMNTANTLMYEWKNIPWRKLEVGILKLQKRIYRASESEDVKTVRKLQRLLLKSRTAKLLAVRKVTQNNREQNLNPQQKIELAASLSLPSLSKPLGRVWITQAYTKSKSAKNNHQKRSRGIETVRDRASQILLSLALEPEWKAHFESYRSGFTPGRSAHDTVKYLFLSIDRQDKYVSHSNISRCFDRVNHSVLLDKLNTFPLIRRAIKAWLKSGLMEGNPISQIRDGITLILVNIVLNGLEAYIQSAFSQFNRLGNITEAPTVVCYGDDLIIMHRDLEGLKRAIFLAQQWLSIMGLKFSIEQNHIRHTSQKYHGHQPGFEFLGFSLRQYQTMAQRKTGAEYKTIIMPTKNTIKSYKAKLSKIIDGNKTATQEKLIAALNPIIMRWTTYYSAVNSQDTFSDLDHWLYIKLRRWANRRHPKKSRKWIVRKYWAVDTKRKWEFTNGNISLIEHRKTPMKFSVNLQDNYSPENEDWRYCNSKTEEEKSCKGFAAKGSASQREKPPKINING